MPPHACPPWLAGVLGHPLRRWLHDPEAILRPFVRPGATVADVGCGPGFFTIAMARLVGDRGRVIAADLEPRMLERTKAAAERAGVAGRVTLHRCGEDSLGLPEGLDFVLAFWMVHEVRGRERFLAEVRRALRPGAGALVAEPPLHVSAANFGRTVGLARDTGYAVEPGPRIRFSRTVMLRRPED